MYKKETFIRLIGVRVNNLVSTDEVQLSLFTNQKSEKQEKLDKTLDEIKRKYGYNAVTRAGNLNANQIVKIINKYE